MGPIPEPVPFSPHAADSAAGSPVAMVGGCIAVAALGLVGLAIMTGAPSTEVESVRPLTAMGGGSGMQTQSSLKAATTVLIVEDGSAESPGSLAEASDEAATTSSSGVPAQQSAGGLAAAEPEDKQDAPADRLPTSPAEAAPGSTDEPPATPEQTDTAVGFPAVYAAPEMTEPPLAAFVVTDRYVLSSAGALDGHTEVFLRVHGEWIITKVMAADAATDVAVLEPADPLNEFDLPAFKIAPDPMALGRRAVAGYCVDPSSSFACATATIDRATLDSSPTTGQTSTKMDMSRVEDVFGVQPATDTITGHTVYDTIKTGIIASPGMAGGPLLDTTGRTKGLVINADWVHVIALPIDRAIAAADRLMAENPVEPWIGVKIRDRGGRRGVRVQQVAPAGPAAEVLAPGDVIRSVDGFKVSDPFHFADVINRTPIGQTVTIELRRRITDADEGQHSVDTTVELTVSARQPSDP